MSDAPGTEVATSPIPDELARRDQWLLWDSRNHRPRQPHWDGDHAISWSDPADWRTFGEAVQRTDQRDEWGLGYVCAAENDDHPRGIFAVIDIDSAVDEHGDPKAWVPSLAPFVDRGAYVEWSPSGTGLHIPVAGFERPAWWSDSQIDDHEGIDVLDNKFCTFTGAALDRAGETVVDYGEWLDEWLADAYEALTGETAPPRQSGAGPGLDAFGGETGDQGGDYDGEEWLTEESVADALDHIDPDVAYATWRNIGFALADHFAEATAHRLFESWSRMGSKWDSDAERQAERIIEGADDAGAGDVTIATVVHHAKQGGWEPDPPEREPSWQELVAQNSPEFDTAEEVPDDLFAQRRQRADGGAVTADSGDESPPAGGGNGGDGGDGGEDDGDPWAAVYQQYAAADNSDERLPARFEATQLLDERGAWRHVVESGVLWRYDAGVGLFRSDGEDSARERLVDGLREQFRAHEQREIVEQLRGRNTVSKDQMGGPDGAVLAANCVLEIGRDEIDTRQPSPDDEFMARVETEFDPEAECPRWRAFVKEVLPTGADRKKVQEFAGYMLHHWGLPHHKALFLVGPTASGKSTMLDTVRAMLGSDSVAALTPQQMAGERFSGAELRGAWANIRNDIPANLIENVGQLKEIIGGDPIKAERKRKDPFMFEPSAKHAFSANQLPDAEVNDEAFFRRILLVPVPDTVPRGERDPALDEKLQAELPGILNWALDGLQRLLKQGRFTADRDPGETQRTWEKWGHSIDRFRETCLEEASGDAIPKADLYSAYVDFCDDEGIPVSSQHKMTRQLKRSGLEDGRQSVDGERQRCILGVDWSSRGEQYAPDGSGAGRPSGLGEH